MDIIQVEVKPVDDPIAAAAAIAGGPRPRWSASCRGGRVVIGAVAGEISRIRRSRRALLLCYGWETPCGPRWTWSVAGEPGAREPGDPLRADHGGWVRGVGGDDLIAAVGAGAGVVLTDGVDALVLDPAWGSVDHVAIQSTMLSSADGDPPPFPPGVDADADAIAAWHIVLSAIPDRDPAAWDGVRAWHARAVACRGATAAALGRLGPGTRAAAGRDGVPEWLSAFLRATTTAAAIAVVRGAMDGDTTHGLFEGDAVAAAASVPGVDHGALHDAVGCAMHAALLAPALCDHGSRTVALHHDGFGTKPVTPETWWPGWSIGTCFIPSLPGDLRLIPVDGFDLIGMVPAAPDPAAAVAAARALSAEGVAAVASGDGGCIPPDAVVEVAHGMFRAVMLHDRGWCVDAVLLREDGAGLPVSLEPNHESGQAVCTIMHPGVDDGAETAGIHLLLAAIVRDFRVVERRERLFDRTLRRIRGPGGGRRGRRVVHLPRRRYAGGPSGGSATPDLPAMDAALGLAAFARPATAVSGHARRCVHPSFAQRLLAERHGFRLSEGMTYVRPHRRGDGAGRPVVYRSRSAVLALTGLADPPDGTGRSDPDIPDWFAFERLAADLLADDGWQIVRRAATPADASDDGGIDVACIRGREDGSHERLVVSCKCWRRDRPIGVAVVRELIGVVALEPEGTSGMLVVRPGLTADAMALADRAGIAVRTP